jgi:AcrR family transcriptional regulator
MLSRERAVKRGESIVTDTPARIVEAARAIVAAEGYDALTMRKVAARLGLTPTAIYFHFADKQALLRALCFADRSAFAEHFRDALRIGDPIERLRAAAHAYVDFAVSRPDQYRILFQSAVPDDQITLEGDGPGSQVYRLLIATTEEAIATGSIRRELADANTLVQILWGTMYGIVGLHTTLANDPNVRRRRLDDLIDPAIDAFLNGVLAR